MAATVAMDTDTSDSEEFDSKEFDYPVIPEMDGSDDVAFHKLTNNNHHNRNSKSNGNSNGNSQKIKEGGELGNNKCCVYPKRSALKKSGQERCAHRSSMVMLKVRFRDVWLREYAMVLGDNPAVSHGAPVQIEWEPQVIHDPIHIDNYDKARSLRRANNRRDLLLNAHKRVQM